LLLLRFYRERNYAKKTEEKDQKEEKKKNKT